MHFNNSTSNESNWAEEEEAAGQRLMCMVLIKAAAKRCKERKDGGGEAPKELICSYSTWLDSIKHI